MKIRSCVFCLMMLLLFVSIAWARNKLEVSYLTENINWKADYVLVLNQADTAADISGWVTLVMDGN